jgi:hypothetical protein
MPRTGLPQLDPLVEAVDGVGGCACGLCVGKGFLRVREAAGRVSATHGSRSEVPATQVVHPDRLGRVRRSPERLESCARPDEPGLGRLTSLHPSAQAELEQDSSKVKHLRSDDEYGDTSKASEDFSPVSVAELGVDSMEEVNVGRKRLVTAQVVVANDYFREDLDEALYGRLSIVGHDELAAWTKLVQPPLEARSPHTVGRNDLRAMGLEPRVDCPRSTRDICTLLGRSYKLIPRGRYGEDSARLRPETVPGFWPDEIVSDDGPIRPEVVVMTNRDS